jgi:ankyrin repeat protein
MEEKQEEYRQKKANDALFLVSCTIGSTADIGSLLDRGASLDARDKHGLTPLHLAASNGHLEAVRILWSKGIDLDLEDKHNRTPLHLAATQGHLDIVNFLLTKGAWSEAYDSQGTHPLHCAARSGNVDIVDALIQAGAKTTPVNNLGLNPAAEAALGGHLECFKILSTPQLQQQQQGSAADNNNSNNNSTPSPLAVFYPSPPQSHSTTPTQYSLLHLTAGLGRVSVLEYLLKLLEDLQPAVKISNSNSNSMVIEMLNSQDNEGRTSILHAAVLGGEPSCVEMLLNAGCDASLVDKDGNTAVDLLEDGSTVKGREIASLLAAHGSGRDSGNVGKKSTTNISNDVDNPNKGLSKLEQFNKLSFQQKLRKVERWSALSTDDLSAAAAQFPGWQELKQRLDNMINFQRAINIHKAITALHSDEEFQNDINIPKIRQAIDILRQNPGAYEQYASDAATRSVLGKLRVMHAVAQSNGQRTINLDHIIIPIETSGSSTIEEWRRRDEEILNGLRKQLTAHTEAAAAAVSNATSEAAAAAAEQTFQACMQRIDDNGDDDKAIKDTTTLPSFSDAIAKEEEDPNMPEWMKGEFSWKKVWKELMRQTMRAGLMIAVMLFTMWIISGRLPWRTGGGSGNGMGNMKEMHREETLLFQREEL